jgi:PEGA domain
MHKLFAAGACAVALSGCATITRGTTDQIQIVSDPSGADVRTSLNQQCVTPCTLQVARSDQFTVVFRKPGYEDQTINVTTKIAGTGAAGFAGNLLVGGIVGMGVDAATGATLEHVPSPVSAHLRPVGPAPKPGKPAKTKRPPQAAVKPAETEAPEVIPAPVS